MLLKVLSIVLCGFHICSAADILAIMPTPSFSHQVAFMELWKELSLRGHKVTIVTTDPRNDPKLENLKELNMKRSYDIWQEKFSDEAQDSLSVFNIWEFFLYFLSDIVEDQLEQPELQDLIYGSEKYHFDVVMLEVFYPELLTFGKIYKCPTILMGTIGSTIQMYDYLGSDVHPVLNPDMNIPYAGKMSFFERFISTIFHWHQIYFEYFTYLPRKQQIIDRYFSNVTRARIEDLVTEIDLMLINESPLFKGIRALGPTTVNVGGGNHLKPLKPLPQERGLAHILPCPGERVHQNELLWPFLGGCINNQVYCQNFENEEYSEYAITCSGCNCNKSLFMFRKKWQFV